MTLFFFISEPGTSIPKALDIISEFGKVSGYKINLSKSIIFPINDHAQQLDFDQFPFKVARDKFTYLGVSVTHKYNDLFKCNMVPALEKAKQDLDRWSLLPISLAGRKNSVKMTILPRLLFLFQTVPVFVPKTIFKNLDTCISSFIWNKNIPRIRKSYLERQKEVMGLALPIFLHYYWASNIHKVIYWISDFFQGTGLLWAEMEQFACNPVSLPSMLCAPLPLSKKSQTVNPIVNGSLRIWSQFRSHFKHKQALTLLPIVSNGLFPPSLVDSAFQIWFRKGLWCIRDLFQNNNFISFEHIVREQT